MEDIIQLDKPENEAQEQIIIKSDLRDKATYHDPSYYQVNFDNPYKKVFSFEVLYTYVPRTEYIIDVFNNQLSYSINEQSYKLLKIDPGDQDLTGLVQNMDQLMYDTVYNKNTATTETVYIYVKSMSTQIQYKSRLVFTCKYPFRFDFSQSTAQQPLGFGNYANPYSNISQYNGTDVQDYTYLGRETGLTYYTMFDKKQPDFINLCKLDQMLAQKFLNIQEQILSTVVLQFNINNIELQKFNVYIYSHDTTSNQPETCLVQTVIKPPATGQQYIVADFINQGLQLQKNTTYWVTVQQTSPYYLEGEDYICTFQQKYVNTGTGDYTTYGKEGISVYTDNSWSFATENTILRDTQYIFIQQLLMEVQTYSESDLNRQDIYTKQPQLSNMYNLTQDQTYAQKFFCTQTQFLDQISFYFNINNTDLQQFTVQVYSHDTTLNQPGTYLAQIETKPPATGYQLMVSDFTDQKFKIIENNVYWVVIKSQSIPDPPSQDFLYTYQKQVHRPQGTEIDDVNTLNYQISIFSKEGILVNTDNNWSALEVQQDDQYIYIQQLSMTVKGFYNYVYNKCPQLNKFYVVNQNIAYAQKFQKQTSDESDPNQKNYQFLDQIVFYLNVNVNKTRFQKYTVYIYSHDTINDQPLNYESGTYLAQTEIQQSSDLRQSGRIIVNFRKSKLKIYNNVTYWVIIKLQDSLQNKLLAQSQPQDYLCTYQEEYTNTGTSDIAGMYGKEGFLIYANDNWQIPPIYYDDIFIRIYKLSMMVQTSHYDSYDYIYNKLPPRSSDLYNLNQDKTYAQKFFSIQNQFLSQVVIYLDKKSYQVYNFTVEIHSHDITQNQPGQQLIQTEILSLQIPSSQTEQQHIIVDFTAQQFQILENTIYWVVIKSSLGSQFSVQDYLCTYQQSCDIDKQSKEGILVYTDNNWSEIQQNKQYVQQLSMKIKTHLESDLTVLPITGTTYQLNQDTIYAQKFINSKNQFLNQINIYLNINKSQSLYQFTVQIYGHDNTYNTPKTGQNLVQTEIQSSEIQSDDRGQYITADFTDSELQMPENTTYWVVIKSSVDNQSPQDYLCTCQQSQPKTDNLNKLADQINTYSKEGILQYINNTWFPLQIQQDDKYIYIQQLQIKYIKCLPGESYIYKKSGDSYDMYNVNKAKTYAQKFHSTQIQFLNQIIIYFNINKSCLQTFRVQIYAHDTANNQPLSYTTETYLAQTEIQASTTGQQQPIIADFTTEKFQMTVDTYYWVVIKSQDLPENQPQDTLCTYLQNYTQIEYLLTYNKGTLVYTDGKWTVPADTSKSNNKTGYLQQLSMTIQTNLGEEVRQIFQSVPSTTNVQGYLFNSKQPQLTDLNNIDKNTVYAQKFYNNEIQLLGQVILYFTVISADPDAMFTISICSSNTSLNQALAQTQINIVNSGKLPTTLDFTSSQITMLANTYYWIRVQSSSDTGCYQIYTYQKQYNQITDAEAITTYGNGTLVSRDTGATWSTLNPMPDSSGIQPIEQLSMQVITYKSQYYMNSPGIVQLTGIPYIVMRCKEIENHLFNVNYDSVKNFGIGLIPLGVNGFVNTSFNFPSIQQKKFHPIGRLQSLTIEFTRPDGTRYNFKGVDHVIVCNIKFYRKGRPNIQELMKFSLLNPSLDFREGTNYYEYQKDFMYNNSKQHQLQQIDDDNNSVNSNNDQYYEQIQNDSQQYVNKDLFVNLQKQNENDKLKYDVPTFPNLNTQ